MIILADSGATKTDWIIWNQEHCEKIQTPGLNPFHKSKELIQQIIEGKILPHCNDDEPMVIRFYGAGCVGEKKKVIEGIFQTHLTELDLVVESDLLGAAKACLGEKEGMIAVLGTGLSTAFYDGDTLHSLVPSLGYLLGDEGSGTFLGKECLRRYLRNEFPKELSKKFEEQFSPDIFSHLQAVYNPKIGQKYFSKFPPFLSENKENPMVQSLVSDALHQFFQYHVLPYQERIAEKNIHFVGSVAFYFEEELRQVATSYNWKVGSIKKTPIEALYEQFLETELIRK